MGVGLALAVIWMLVVGVGKAVRRRLRYLSRDPRRVATASRQELEGFLRDQGVVVGANTTLASLQRAVRLELGLECGAFATAVARARYGPPETVEQGARTARVELRRLLARSPSRPVHLGPLPRVRVAPVAPVRRVGVSETYDLFQLGRSHLRNGMPAQATVPLEKAKRNEPTSRSIREALGIAYFRIRRWEEAEAEFRALVELDPSDEFAHYALGRTLVNQGRRDEATPHIKLARSLRPRAADGDTLE